MTYARLVLIATNQEELETLFWRHNLKTRMKDWRAITMYWEGSVTSSINQLLIFCRKGLWLSSIILSGAYFLSTRWVNLSQPHFIYIFRLQLFNKWTFSTVLSVLSLFCMSLFSLSLRSLFFCLSLALTLKTGCPHPGTDKSWSLTIRTPVMLGTNGLVNDTVETSHMLMSRGLNLNLKKICIWILS